MFRKEEELEHDFMEYGKENAPEKEKKETNILGKTIQLLSVIVLLGIVGFMGFFGYKYMQKDMLGKKDNIADSSVQNNTKTAPSENASQKVSAISATKSDTKQKMYTQDQMQVIVQTLMAQMQTVKQTAKKQSAVESVSSKVSDTSEDKALVSALNNVEVDQLEEIDEDVPMHANQDKIYKAETKKSTKKVDHYNKVVVQTSQNTYDDLANLSLEIGNVVDDMKTHDEKQSSYTNSIKKEVVTRSNEMRVIVVKSGDSLSKIAKRAYGSAQAYDRIMEANPDLIKNPDHIYVGQRLRVPLDNN